MACKSTWTFSKGQEYMWWNNVESKPYGGYPQNWDAKLLAMLEAENPGGQVWDAAKADGDGQPYGVFEGKTIFEAADKRVGPEGPQAALGYLPTDAEWRHPNIHEDTATGGDGREGQFGGSAQLPEHRVWFFHLARICNHCTYPGCLASCPRQAIYKRPEDGIVLIDQERCRGYRKCVEGCPYKKAMYRGTTRTSEKCVGCFPRIEGKDDTLSPDGAPLETRCMSACVGKIRLQGLVEIGDRWALDARSDQPALLPDPRAQGRPAALSAVRHRAERLLHPAPLGAARLPRADVRPRRRARHRTVLVSRPSSCWRCCSSSGPSDRSCSASRSRKGRRSPKSPSRFPRAR